MYNTLDPKIYRSSDQGETWLFMGSLPPGTRVTKLEVEAQQLVPALRRERLREAARLELRAPRAVREQRRGL
jgi:hypothetical protein